MRMRGRKAGGSAASVLPAASLSLCLDLSCSRPYPIPLSAVCYFHCICVATRRRHAHTVWYADLTAAAADAATRQVTIRCTPTISISTLHCCLKRRYLATVWMLCLRDDYPETLSWNANGQIPCPAGQPTTSAESPYCSNHSLASWRKHPAKSRSILRRIPLLGIEHFQMLTSCIRRRSMTVMHRS